MKLINQRLIDDPQTLSDASVTSIALLVIQEVSSFQVSLIEANNKYQTISGSLEAASTHQIGLLKLIKLRGGICVFQKNCVLLRVLAW